MNVPEAVVQAIAEVRRTGESLAWAQSDTFRVPGDLGYAEAEAQQAEESARMAVVSAMADFAAKEVMRMRVVLGGRGTVTNQELRDYAFARTAELRDRCRRCGYEARAHHAPDGGGCPGDFAKACDCSANPRAMADGCPKCKP